MKVLSLESSSPKASIALSDETGSLFFDSEIRKKSHAEYFHPQLEKAFDALSLSTKDIDAFGLSLGPGSFTGIRISYNIIRSFAFLTKKPVYGVNSMKLIAASQAPSDKSVAVLLNAFGGEAFWATYEWKSQTLQETLSPYSLPWEKAQELAKEHKGDILGYGIPDKIRGTLSHFTEAYPSAQTINDAIDNKSLDLKPLNWDQIHPHYIKKSSAEIVHGAKLSTKS